MSGTEITRQNVTRVRIEIPRFGTRWKLEHFQWMMREVAAAREQVDVPDSVEVKIGGDRMVLDYSIHQDIP